MEKSANEGYVYPKSFTGGRVATWVTTNVSVGSTSTAVLAERLTRKYLCLSNDSNETIYISIENAAEMNKGIMLSPGASLEFTGPYLFTNKMYGICSSGTKNLAVMEGY